MISKDGYNLGRDWLVEKALMGGRWKGFWWKAEVEWREGLLNPGKEGGRWFSSIHADADGIVGVNHGIAQDGRVAILTVNRQ